MKCEKTTRLHMKGGGKWGNFITSLHCSRGVTKVVTDIEVIANLKVT